MKSFPLNFLSIALLSTFALAASVQAMTKPEYKAQEEKIESEGKMSKAACSKLAGQPKSMCLVEAKGTTKLAKAELEAAYKHNAATRYKAHQAKADTAYDVARELCNEKTANEKDVCVKEAKAAQTAALADAKVQQKTSDANMKATEKKVDANASAVDDKNTANYKVAYEKCDSLAGAPKTTCQDQAKKTYGK